MLKRCSVVTWGRTTVAYGHIPVVSHHISLPPISLMAPYIYLWEPMDLTLLWVLHNLFLYPQCLLCNVRFACLFLAGVFSTGVHKT